MTSSIPTGAHKTTKNPFFSANRPRATLVRTGSRHHRRNGANMWVIESFTGWLLQWRAIGELSGIAFGTLFSLFARQPRLGLWRRHRQLVERETRAGRA